MPARLPAAAVALALLLPACSSDSDGPTPAGKAVAVENCTVSLDLEELRRSELHPVDGGSTVLHRELRATTSPEGHLCLDIVTGHADYGSVAVAYRIVARQGDREWRVSGEEPSGMAPMRVAGAGCVTANATLTALGAGDKTYRYRARLRVHCDGPGSADSP